MTDLYDKLIGIPWFRPERYDVARARMADVDRLPPVYDVWRQRAEEREEKVRREGNTPNRVNVDDDRFVDFCAERNQVLDGKARSNYALARTAGVNQKNVTDYDHPEFRHGAKH